MKRSWLLSATFVASLLFSPTAFGGSSENEDPLPGTTATYQVRASVLGSSGGAGTSPSGRVLSSFGQGMPAGDGISAGGLASGVAQYAGLCAAAWSPVPVSLAADATYPPGQTIPAFSAIPRIVLTGFALTNRSSVSVCIDYALESSGPATISANGHPGALVGRTPPLLPGQSFTPPEAVLLVPEIRSDAVHNVAYQTAIVNTVGLDEREVVSIEFVAPVPVLIQQFKARVLEGAVELSWEIESDEGVRGFQIYRRDGSAGERLLGPGEWIAPDARRWLDGDVRAGMSYEYTLVVASDADTEFRSYPVPAKIPVLEFTLYPNHPNPFNPATTISFALPRRGHVVLSVFDVDGRLVRTLIDGVVDDGLREARWDGTNQIGERVSSGVYFCRIQTGNRTLTNKMVLLK